MPAKSYPPAFVARSLVVLAANSGSVKAAAAELGISRSTLRGWRDGQVPLSMAALSSEERSALSEESAESAASQYRTVKALYVQQLKRPEVVRAATAVQAATVVGIMSDKEARALGKPTDRTEHVLSMADWFKQALGKGPLNIIDVRPSEGPDEP